MILDVRQKEPPKKLLITFEIKYKGHSEMRNAWVNSSQQIIGFLIDEVPTGVVVDPENTIILGRVGIRHLWDPVFGLMIISVGIGAVGLMILKRRKTLHPPPTPLDHFLETEFLDEGPENLRNNDDKRQ
jgi:hypothetical protein